MRRLGAFVLAFVACSVGAAAGDGEYKRPFVVGGKACPSYIKLYDCGSELGLGGMLRDAPGVVDLTGVIEKWRGTRFEQLESGLFETQLREFLVEKLTDKYVDLIARPPRQAYVSDLEFLERQVRDSCGNIPPAGPKFADDRFFPARLVSGIDRKRKNALAERDWNYPEIAQATACLDSIDQRLKDLASLMGPRKIETLAESSGHSIGAQAVALIPWYHVLFDNVLNSSQVRAAFKADCGAFNPKSSGYLCVEHYREELKQLAAEKEELLRGYPYLGETSPDKDESGNPKSFYESFNTGVEPAPYYTIQLDMMYARRRAEPLLAAGRSEDEVKAEMAAEQLTYYREFRDKHKSPRCMALARPPGPKRLARVKDELYRAVNAKKDSLLKAIARLCDPSTASDTARAAIVRPDLMTAFAKCEGLALEKGGRDGFKSVCEYRRALSASACAYYADTLEKDYWDKLKRDAFQGAMISLELFTLPETLGGIGSLGRGATVGGVVKGVATGVAVQKTFEEVQKAALGDPEKQAQATADLAEAGFGTDAERRAALKVLAESPSKLTEYIKAGLIGGFFSLGHGAGEKPIRVTPELYEELLASARAELRELDSSADAASHARRLELGRAYEALVGAARDIEIKGDALRARLDRGTELIGGLRPGELDGYLKLRGQIERGELSVRKLKAIEEAHRVGEGGKGRYSQTEITRKKRALLKAGFSPKEADLLLRAGVCGDEARLGAGPAVARLLKSDSLKHGIEFTATTDGNDKFNIRFEVGGKKQDFVKAYARRFAAATGGELRMIHDGKYEVTTPRLGAWIIHDDSGVVEVTSPPMLDTRPEVRAEIDTVFKTFTDVGLKPEVKLGGIEGGGGHIHIDGVLFEKHPVLLRNLVADFMNNPCLQGILEESQETTAKGVRDAGREAHMREALARVDLLLKDKPNATVDEVASLLYEGWTGKKPGPNVDWEKNLAINFSAMIEGFRPGKPRTVEFRFFRAPKSALESERRVAFMKHYLASLAEHPEPIEVRPLAPAELVHAELPSVMRKHWDELLSRIGLDPKDYAGEWDSKFKPLGEGGAATHAGRELEIRRGRVVDDLHHYEFRVVSASPPVLVVHGAGSTGSPETLVLTKLEPAPGEPGKFVWLADYAASEYQLNDYSGARLPVLQVEARDPSTGNVVHGLSGSYHLGDDRLDAKGIKPKFVPKP